jgi:hypothetical protein
LNDVGTIGSSPPLNSTVPAAHPGGQPIQPPSRISRCAQRMQSCASTGRIGRHRRHNAVGGSARDVQPRRVRPSAAPPVSEPASTPIQTGSTTSANRGIRPTWRSRTSAKLALQELTPRLVSGGCSIGSCHGQRVDG